MFFIRHETKYHYPQPAAKTVQRLLLTPEQSKFQHIKNWKIDLEGTEMVLNSRDHHGNLVHIIAQQEEVSDILIIVSGEVETYENFGIYGPHDNMLPLALYKRDTSFCKMGPKLRKLYSELPSTEDALSFLHETSVFVANKITYKKEVTKGDTDAETAVCLGHGVCQDHVHIFLTLARKKGFPARYVSGYLMTSNIAENTQTHAWAEVYLDDLGWVGFDISNKISPDETYIRLATGFDYQDVRPVAGLRYGEGEEMMTTEVSVQ